jgi:chromate transporter
MKDSEADNRSLPSNSRSSLRELIGLYVKLGTIGFGGPQAHIAMQYIEVVERRQWLTQAQFVEGMAICEMLPGPASTQMGIYIGYLCAGQLGAFLAGVSFIAPAFCIVLALSWAYFRYQQTPQLAGLFVGVSPVVVAIIVGFCWKLAAKTVLVKEASPKQRYGRVAIFAAVTVATLLRVNILLQLLLAGLAGLWIFGVWPSPPLRARSWMLPIVLSPFFADVSPDILSLSSVWGTERILAYGWPLALFFLKLGSFIFGGGLVIIPFIESEVVELTGGHGP